MDYQGVIIEESLIDTSIIHNFDVLQQEIAEVTERENTPWLKQWTMDTVSIRENEIEEATEKLSKLIETEHCSDWYCDFKNDQFHYVVFANKVFRLDRSKKEDYLEMQEYALELGLPKEQLPTFHDLPTNLLIGFLIDAKKQTYASGTKQKAVSSRDGSVDYDIRYEVEGEVMKYHDTYFGGVRFMGEEVVYRGSDVPKWGMNYYGVTLDETLSEEAMDQVLRPALMKVGEDSSVLPLRGPSKFENAGYLYTFRSSGSMEDFQGIEEISKDGKLIYRLVCHGGMLE